MLLVELLVSSLLVDAQPLRTLEGAAALLGYGGSALALTFAVAAALAILAQATAPAARLETEPTRHGTGTGHRGMLVLHALLFASFLGQTLGVFELGGLGPLRIGAWATTGLLSVTTLLFAFANLAELGALVRRWLPRLPLGVLVGATAFGAGIASETLWRLLAHLTLRTVAVLLGLFAPSTVVELESAVVGTDRFTVEIAPECSGYEGIGLILALSSAYLVAARSRLRFPQAILLLPIAVLSAFAANAVRIVLLVLVGHHVSEELALGGFHSKAGWVLFSMLSLVLVYSSQRLSFFARDPAVRAVEPGTSAEVADGVTNPAAPFLVPLLALIGTGLATALVSPGFDRLFALRYLAAAVAMFFHRRVIGSLRLEAAWVPAASGVLVAFLWILLEPAGRIGGYVPSGGAGLVHVATRAIGSTLIVPVVEELAFRGYLLRRLAAASFWTLDPRRCSAAPVLVSSLAFGLLHQRILAGTLAGLVFAWTYRRRGELMDAMLAHAIANGILAGFVIATERWTFWW